MLRGFGCDDVFMWCFAGEMYRVAQTTGLGAAGTRGVSKNLAPGIKPLFPVFFGAVIEIKWGPRFKIPRHAFCACGTQTFRLGHPDAMCNTKKRKVPYLLCARRRRTSIPCSRMLLSAAKERRKWVSCWLKMLPGMMSRLFSMALVTNSVPVPQGTLGKA